MNASLIASLALVLGGAITPLQAQNPGAPRPAPQIPSAGPGEIRGLVVDAESKAPVASASVSVSTKGNGLVAGAIAQQDGTFRVEGLRPGVYVLRVTMLGYGTWSSPDVTIDAANPRVNAGSIALARAPIALEGVEANAERAVVIAPDRNTYRARDVAPAATTATDVLEAVPAVQIDADGKLSLRGNENVVVQINGRPSPIRGTQLAGYLKQLPANTIERVEVIPNPSAKQDPEGMAGIVNIVLKQSVDLGRSMGLTLAASTADRYTGAGNFGYQAGKVSLFATYGFNSDKRIVDGINDRTRLDALRDPTWYTEQDIDSEIKNAGHNLSTNIDYKLSQKDLLFTTLSFNRRGMDDGSLSAYSEWTSSRTLDDRYSRLRNQENENWMADVTFGLKRTMMPQKHELNAEMRFNHQDDEEQTGLWREPFFSSSPSALDQTRVDRETNALAAVTNQLTAQLDYTRMLGEKTKLETGYKGNGRWLDRDFDVLKDPNGTGQWEASDLSNALEFDEMVNAGYAVLSQGRGKFDLQAGLRAEYAHRDFSLEGGENYPHGYSSFFPSGLVNYKADDKTQVKLSYSRRIRRPGTQELSPFPVFFDVQNVFLGNPRLDPEYTDAIEFSFQRSGQLGSLQVSPFYRRTSDIIRVDINTADTVSNREVTSISFKNLDTGTSWGADVNTQLRKGPLSVIGGVNIFKMVTDGGSTSSLSSDAVTWMGRINATMNLSATTMVQAMYFYRAPMNIERGRFHSTQMANFTIRRKIYGDKGSVSLRVSDPFDTNKFRVNVGDDNIIQLTDRSFNARAVHLTFQYNTGQAPRLRQRKQEEQAQPQTGFPGQ